MWGEGRCSRDRRLCSAPSLLTAVGEGKHQGAGGAGGSGGHPSTLTRPTLPTPLPSPAKDTRRGWKAGGPREERTGHTSALLPLQSWLRRPQPLTRSLRGCSTKLGSGATPAGVRTRPPTARRETGFPLFPLLAPAAAASQLRRCGGEVRRGAPAPSPRGPRPCPLRESHRQ